MPCANRKCFLLVHCQVIDFHSCFPVPRQAFLTGFPMKIKKSCIFNWISVESLETINKLSTLHLPWKPDISPSPVTMVKSHEKRCLSYFCVGTSQLTMVKCCRDVNFEEIDTVPSTRKKWWVLISMKNI